MSDHEQGGFYYHDPFQDNNLYSTFSLYSTNSSLYNPNSPTSIATSSPHHDLQGYNNILKTAFALVKEEQNPAVADAVCETPPTPNSSLSSSNSEKSEKDRKPKDGGESSKKVTKSRKKGERKQREPRFAFMTKSEVDHLEDGYRWRKYGQKAVKNSPFPRSYYRCTTQKCTVKKRVERSFEDPSVVVTTYEGQHNHPIPSTLRGNVAAAPMAVSSGLIPQMALGQNYYGGMSSFYPQRGTSFNPIQQHLQVPPPHADDYGLLQDMVPSMFFKQEP